MILTTKNWWRRLEAAPNWWRRKRTCKRTHLLVGTYTLSWTTLLTITTRKKDEVKSKITTIKVTRRQLKTMPFTTTRNVAAAWTSWPPSTSPQRAYSETIAVNRKKCSKDLETPNRTTKQLLNSSLLQKDSKKMTLEQLIDSKDSKGNRVTNSIWMKWRQTES